MTTTTTKRKKYDVLKEDEEEKEEEKKTNILQDDASSGKEEGKDTRQRVTGAPGGDDLPYVFSGSMVVSGKAIGREHKPRADREVAGRAQGGEDAAGAGDEPARE